MVSLKPTGVVPLAGGSIRGSGPGRRRQATEPQSGWPGIALLAGVSEKPQFDGASPVMHLAGTSSSRQKKQQPAPVSGQSRAELDPELLGSSSRRNSTV